MRNIFRFPFYFALFLLVNFANVNDAYAVLPAPEWKCISTNGNDVVLNWSPVLDPGGIFIKYEIHSLQAGKLGESTNIANTTFTHLGSNVVSDYFISVIDNTDTTASIVLKNIRLTVNNPSNGTAILNWNHMGNASFLPPGNGAVIERKYDATPFVDHDSVPSSNTFLRDTIDVCSANFGYRIKIKGNGCDFTSNEVYDDFEDRLTPAIPNVLSVSIDDLNQDVHVTWAVNSHSDTYGYVIYKQTAGFLVEIDTVWGRTNTVYTYTEPVIDAPLVYSIAAFDSCFTASMPPSYQTSAKGAVHKTQFLTTTFNECLSTVRLNWVPYVGWNSIESHDVYYRTIGGTWIFHGNTTSSAYSIPFTVEDDYEFMVKAKHLDGRESYSNWSTESVKVNLPPTINYILHASVSNEGITIEHLVNTSGNVSAIAIDRYNYKLNDFFEVGRTNVTDIINQYTDRLVPTDIVNRYRVTIIDSCGNRTVSSAPVETILNVTKVDPNNANKVQMSWTPYVGFDGNVESYDIVRVIDGIPESMPAANVGATTFNYSEDIPSVTVGKTLCYQIVARENLNSYGYAESASSNEGCIDQAPLIFIPSAFYPGGANPIFNPVISYHDYDDFSMKIFNRWNQLLFSTNDRNEGWNGQMQGSNENAKPDVYVCILQFKNKDNDENLVYKETVVLIR